MSYVSIAKLSARQAVREVADSAIMARALWSRARRPAASVQGLAMHKRLISLLIWLALFVVVAMLIGSLLDFLPAKPRDWLGYIVIPIAVLWFVYSWFRWHRKQVGDRNEVEWLDELVEEQEKGIRDNSNTLKHLIPTIEREHEMTPDLVKRLERARRVLSR